ncbi:acyl carrier protein [Streptomyces sp. NPDC020875]|uniref:acyl carrier protein n=1 Tax=Streptomyces sp. NPDC020875 TaxID=3154898 RepID=UPI0033F42803
MDQAAAAKEIERYIRTEFLDGDPSAELAADSPLLEWGVLNSMNITRLVAFLNERFGAEVAPGDLVPSNFRDVDSVARLAARLAPEGAATD